MGRSNPGRRTSGKAQPDQIVAYFNPVRDDRKLQQERQTQLDRLYQRVVNDLNDADIRIRLTLYPEKPIELNLSVISDCP